MQELEDVWPDADVSLGKMKLPDDVDRLIVSPGIADKDPLIKKARKAELEVVSDIELFARDAEAPYAAVTGSNGKSTVTTLLYHMARAAGNETLAGGNLGEPALDLLTVEKPDLYVLELSSFSVAPYRVAGTCGRGTAQCFSRSPGLASQRKRVSRFKVPHLSRCRRRRR